MAKNFMDVDRLAEVFKGHFLDVVDNYGYDRSEAEDYCEEYAWAAAQRTERDMCSYAHRKDTRMDGNFCNIRQDWEQTIDFVASEVRPCGKLDDVVRSIDEGAISDADLARWHTWVQDWYFTAFGTYNLKYNFGEALIAYMEEMEREAA